MNGLGFIVVFAACAIAANAETCAEKNARRIKENGGKNMPGFELETCLPDGSFAAKQCQFGGCSCYSAAGATLVEFTRSNLDIMNCECARAKDEAKGRLGVEFRCDDATGNYLPMQCHGSMCYCADAHGKQVGKSVPRQDSGSLSC